MFNPLTNLQKNTRKADNFIEKMWTAFKSANQLKQYFVWIRTSVTKS